MTIKHFFRAIIGIMEKIKRILTINFGGIGDEILFLPTLISLKQAYPEVSITLALEPRSKGIKDLTDVIDDMFLIDVKSKNKYSELLKLIFLARTGKFDMVISSGGNKLISILLFLMGIKRRYGYNSGRLSEILLTKAVKLNKNQYACDMYHDLITPITEIKTKLPQIKVDGTEKESNTILIHPGVSKLSVQLGIIKTITPEKWAQVIDMLLESGKKVILTGGPDDKDCVTAIMAHLKNIENTNFVDYYGKTKNLMELAKLIASCEKFVCSDSAPLHVAVALGVKTYVVFGPTDYNKLIPKTDMVVPLLANDNCDLKPCLWEKRQTTCEGLACLEINPLDIANIILQK